MPVTDDEKRSIKDSVYEDHARFKESLIESLKNDDVQKSVFLATIKGASLYIFLGMIGCIVWVARSLPPVQDLLSLLGGSS